MFVGLVVALLVSPQVLVVAAVVAVIVVAVVRWTNTPCWAPLAVTLPILGIALLVRDQPLHDVAVMTRRFFQAGFHGHFRGTLERHWREWLATALPFSLALGSVVGVWAR